MSSKQISDDYQQFADEGKKYRYVYYEPSLTAISVNDKGCVIPPESKGDQKSSEETKLKMVPLDNNLHTYETCKFGASVKFSEFKKNEKLLINSGDIVKIPGLPFKIVAGYYADDPTYFIDKPNIDPDGNNISTDFRTLNTELGGNYTSFWSHYGFDFDKVARLNNNGGHTFSIEWYGYFIPNITGQWEFYAEGDDATYLWLGEHAVNDYTVNNAEIKLGGLHGAWGKSKSIYVTKGQIYPIRMQFGENHGARNFTFNIKGPDGKDVKYTDVLFHFKTKSDGKLYELTHTYIALVEDTPENTEKKLFKCLIPENTEDNKKKLKMANYETPGNSHQTIFYNTIWSAFNEKNPAEYSKIHEGNVLTLTIKGNLEVYYNDNMIKKIIPDIDYSNFYLNNDDAYTYLIENIKPFMNWVRDPNNQDIVSYIASSKDNNVPNSNADIKLINFYWKQIVHDTPLKKHRLVLDVSCNVPNPADQDTNTCIVRLYAEYWKGNKWNSRGNDIFPPITVKDAVIVEPWGWSRSYYGITTNTMNAGETLLYTNSNPDNMRNNKQIPFILSMDNRFKLIVNELGNIKLIYAKKACQNRQTMKNNFGDELTYTYTDINNSEYYLYRINVDEKMGKINYLDGSRKTISIVPNNLYDYTGNSYNKFGGEAGKFIPSNTNDAIKGISTDDCKTSCDTNSNCTMYYSYTTKDNLQNCKISTDNTFQPIPMENNTNIKDASLYLKNPKINDATNKDKKMISIPYKYLTYKDEDVGWIENDNENERGVEGFSPILSKISNIWNKSIDNKKKTESFSNNKKRDKKTNIESFSNGSTFIDQETVTDIQCRFSGDSKNITSIGGEWTGITTDFNPNKQIQIPTWQDKPVGMTGIAVSGDESTVLICNWWSTGCIYFSKKKQDGTWTNFKRTLHYYSDTPTQGSVITDMRWYWMGLLGISLSFDGKVGTTIHTGGKSFYFKWDETQQNYTMGIEIPMQNASLWFHSIDMVRNPNPNHININNVIIAASWNGIYFSKWNNNSKTYGNLINISAKPRNYLGITISSDGNTIAYCDYNESIYIAKFNGVDKFINEMMTLSTSIPLHTRNLKFSTDIDNRGFPSVLFYTTIDISLYDKYQQELPSCLWYSTWNGKTYTDLKPVSKSIIPSKLDAWGLCVCPSTQSNMQSIYVMSISPYPCPIYKVNMTFEKKSYTRMNENTYNSTNDYNPAVVGVYSNEKYIKWVNEQRIKMVGDISSNINIPPPGPMSSTINGTSGTNSIVATTQGFRNMYEGFEYDTKPCTIVNTNDPNNRNCVEFINNKKFNPLMSLSNEFNQKQNQINNNYKSLGEQITEYKTNKNVLVNDSKYKYATNHGIIDKEDSPSLSDKMNSDINELLIQENNLYILGSITTATLIILAIMISSTD
jgi:hypothetical protein